MNILDIQDKLKNFSQEQLIQEMQMPTGQLPQFLLLSEITRRKKMQDSYAQQQDQAQEQTTVAQDAINAAGMPQEAAQQLAGTMAPQTDMAGNTGAMPQQQMMPQAPQPVQGMAGGGIVALKDGGRIVVRNGRRFVVQPDGSLAPETPLRASELQTPAVRESIQEGGISFPSYEMLSRQQRKDLGYPVSELGGQLAFDRFGVGLGLVDPATRFSPSGLPVLDAQTAGGGSAPPSTPATPMSYEQILAAARAGQMPTYDTLAASAELLNDQQAADVNAMIDSGYMPDADEQHVSSMPGVTRVEPDAPYSVRAGAIPDYLAGVFGGRTVGEQAEIDAERARLSGGLSETPPEVQTPGKDTVRPPARPDAPPTATPPGPPRGPSGGGIAGAAAQGAAAPSDFEQELMTMLAAREKRAEQDKFLALAQAGMALMSSTQPTFGGALGEAGASGLGALREGQAGSEADRLALLGQIEQSRLGREQVNLQRQALAARSAAGGGDRRIPVGIITPLMGELQEARMQLSRLPPPPGPGAFGRVRQDPYMAERSFLRETVDQLTDTVNAAGAQYGISLAGTGAGPTPLN